MTRSLPRRIGGASLALAGLILAGPALAQQSVHVRGEVAAISGDTVTMQTTDGETVEVAMASDYALMLYQPIAIEDVKEGDYLSIPSITGPEGDKEALAINVFPEAMRGTGEGVSDWDIAPESQMTNATVGTMESLGEDHAITVTYQDQEETVQVPDGTPITSFGPVPDRRLAVGDMTVLFAQEADGAYSAGAAGVSEDGGLPPI